MRIFVTGGTGFIGSHFLREAMRDGHEVIALRRDSSPGLDLPVRWVSGDLETYPRESLDGCAALVHLAAHGLSAQSDWEGCYRWNARASIALMLEAWRRGVRRMVICGTCSEYGRSAEHFEFVPPAAPLLPTEPYGASKAAMTLAAISLGQQQNLEVNILRPFHIYGEGESANRFWPSLRAAARKGADFPMTAGEQVRDFTPVELVARKFANALARADIIPGQPLIENVGAGAPATLRAFAERWWNTWRAPGRLLFGAIPYRHNEVMRYVPELTAADQELAREFPSA